MTCVSLSQDGRLVAVGLLDSTVKVINVHVMFCLNIHAVVVVYHVTILAIGNGMWKNVLPSR